MTEKHGQPSGRRRQPEHTVSLDGYRHMGNSCSTTDCTGLIPALPTSDAELEAYEEMYQFCARNRTEDI